VEPRPAKTFQPAPGISPGRCWRTLLPTVVDRGLEGVVVGSTQLSNVEGGVGRLTYRGYDIDDLAPNATFEEIVHLLLYGHLPGLL
jgi:citrate synthase